MSNKKEALITGQKIRTIGKVKKIKKESKKSLR